MSLIWGMSTVSAVPSKFLYTFDFEHDYYGRLTAILPEVTIRLYDEESGVFVGREICQSSDPRWNCDF